MYMYIYTHVCIYTYIRMYDHARISIYDLLLYSVTIHTDLMVTNRLVYRDITRGACRFLATFPCRIWRPRWRPKRPDATISDQSRCLVIETSIFAEPRPREIRAQLANQVAREANEIGFLPPVVTVNRLAFVGELNEICPCGRR